MRHVMRRWCGVKAAGLIRMKSTPSLRAAWMFNQPVFGVALQIGAGVPAHERAAQGRG
jgi:hypothetical protein